MLVAAATFVAATLLFPGCGPVALIGCTPDLVVGGVAVVSLAAALYVIGLSGVLWWVRGLRAREVTHAGAARDWYLLAAVIGLAVAPLLAFTLVSAFR